MKTASSELSITIISIVAIGLILAFLLTFIPDLLGGIKEDIEKQRGYLENYTEVI
jgi:predicted PurR-regulated permease PerM